ncbi:DNA methyltransferase [Fodinicola feengrottensis]|uniref:DNA methyltransferase n=1 Tax=Fodinicola feengrottensis TaxID=435914 RepID=UPI0036F23914
MKPVDLMRWLVRLMTPPNGLILDPFLGSGTTAQAARAEGMRCLGIEQNQTYLPLITQRLSRPGSPPPEPPAQTAAGER